MNTLSKSEEYVIASRRIAGTHAEKLDQIDEAIQELLDIKLLECAADQPNVHLLAVPRRSHWFGMTLVIVAMLALLILLLGERPAHAQTVTGAGTPTDTELRKRLEALEAQVTELKRLLDARVGSPDVPATRPAAEPAAAPAAGKGHDLKFGVGLDTYFGFNFNRPIGRVNLLRAYDVTGDNFSLNQAGLILESAPDVPAGRRIGGRIDLQYGQATETLQGSLANEPRPWVYRNVFQAYGTVVAPVGSGLTIDFGKWASSLGLENNYTKDQMNYSRSYWFNFLPFYHMGGRVNYRFNDAVALNYWITNGTQQTEDFNNFKDQFVGLVLQPAKSVTWATQYYLGQEHPDVQQIQTPGPPTQPIQPGLSVVPVDPSDNGKLHIFDTYATWQPTPATIVAAEADYVVSQNQIAPDSRVFGGALYFRRQVTPKTALAVRAEYLRDRGGLFTGTTQSLGETTVTYDYRLADGFLARSEWRRDFASTKFFPTNRLGTLKKDQHTGTLGLIWWWGTKRGSW